VLRNDIHHGRTHGVSVDETGTGLLESNTISDNAGHGIFASGKSDMVVTANSINRNCGSGCHVEGGACGTWSGNYVYVLLEPAKIDSAASSCSSSPASASSD
jgi:parallel beta-helix repeat protein